MKSHQLHDKRCKQLIQSLRFLRFIVFSIPTILILICFATLLCQVSLADSDATRPSAAVRIEQLLQDDGPGAAATCFAQMDKGPAGQYYFDENEFNASGYRFLMACDYEKALVPFEIGAQLYPDSWNSWDSLADCYRHLGYRELALEHYHRALELNPGDEALPFRIMLIDRFITDNSAQTSQMPQFSPGEPTGLKGPYLGQVPPGRTPKLFAPGIISLCTRYEYNPTFSPDGKLLYFSTNYGLYVCRETAEGWTMPEPAAITGYEPHITHDGSQMIVGRGLEIWALDRSAAGWENARKICDGMRPWTSADGALYVTMVDPERDPVNLLGVARPTADGYDTPVALPPSVNNPRGGAHPCVSADGRTMIFDSYRQATPENEYDDDLYITRRSDDGSWSQPEHLGFEINTAGSNFCASLSPDGKYLFYTSNLDIFWISLEGL